MKNVINRAFMAKKKILFVLAAVCLFAASSWAQSCTYDHTTGVIKIYKNDGSLKGEFSVSATKKVKFSQGNLQYQASTDTWRFAEHQWDAIGGTGTDCKAPLNVTSGNNTAEASRATQSDWIDLFGWATSGNSASGTRYQPWQCSDSYSQYGNTSKSDGSSPGSGENWDASKADWAQNMPGSWRTLTIDEWGYLIGTVSPCRTNATYLRKWTTVNSVPGLIIMPDGWSGSIAGTYDLDAWTTLEGQGAVFLPAAGIRHTCDVDNAGKFGFYWSSTAQSAQDAYLLFFLSSSAQTTSTSKRSYGNSVRLVKDVVVTP